MALSTDKDKLVIVLRACYRSYVIGSLLSEERRTTLLERSTRWTTCWGILQALLLSVGLG